MPTKPDDATDAMHLLLGTLIHSYARLDHFIGLQLKWLGEYRGQEVGALLDKGVAFKRRFKRLKQLALETWAHSDTKVADQFAAWFKQVEHVQRQRNTFAHGRWGYMPTNSKEVEFVELSWETNPIKQKPAVKVVLRDFQHLVDEV